MKKSLFVSRRRSRQVKSACTVSAAALMLGVSHAAVVGLHFQAGWDDAGSPGYTGFPVTATAFGISPASWENLTPTETGYGNGDPGPFFLTESIDTTSNMDGLNPLPSGSISISWQANAANTSGFGINDPVSCRGGNQPHRGEQEVYNGFLRDGVFIYTSPTTTLSNYSVTISGLKSLFPKSQYAVRLIAATDSGKIFTNATVTSTSTTASLTYTAVFTNFYDPNVFVPGDPSRVAGIMGGLSSTSPAFNDDSITIAGGPAYDGPGGRQYTGSGPDSGPGIASTISGIMLADSPIIVYPPTVPAGLCAGDNVILSVDAFGAPPLSYQWRLNGTPISGATSPTLAVSDLGPANAGAYDVVVANAYGTATTAAAEVAGPELLLHQQDQLIVDTKPNGAKQNGLNNGATWVASSSDGTKTRTGVIQFSGVNDNQINLTGATNLQSPVGAISFWMRSAGTLTASPEVSPGALMFTGGDGYDSDLYGLAIVQDDIGSIDCGTLGLTGSSRLNGNAVNLTEGGQAISDDKWHLITVNYDSTTNGGIGLFVDGALDTTNSNTGSWTWPTNNAQEVALGLSHKTNYRPYDGLMDDVRVYSRILTPSEISQIYTSDAIIDSNALQLRYNFDTAPASGYSLNWTCGNALQTSTNVAGPYGVVTSASSPWYITTGDAQRFYKTE